MDPATLATTAIAAALPYVTVLGKEAAKSAAGAAGKSIWEWVKNKLTSAAGNQAVNDLENGPYQADNRKAAEAALSKFLRSDPNAVTELARILDQVGATSATLSALVTGNNNNLGQVFGSGAVSINQDKTS
jgi:hypothetical protein